MALVDVVDRLPILHISMVLLSFPVVPVVVPNTMVPVVVPVDAPWIESYLKTLWVASFTIRTVYAALVADVFTMVNPLVVPAPPALPSIT